MLPYRLALVLVAFFAAGLPAAEPEKPEPLWSLQPLRKVAPPEVRDRTLVRSPIDPFILGKLSDKGLSYQKLADPRQQIRRVYFDLIGLPPPPDVIEAFAKNPSDEAYLKIVDQLLASPQHGERQARLWLDLVRFGESDGFERNFPRANAWPYRDWVIQALNSDMPYDQFTRMQLAGDALEPDKADAIAATGFLVAGIHNTVVGVNPVMQANARQDELEDLIAGVGQTFLGLSVQCARCHDHKFDPITMVDYYRLAASLSGVTHGERAVKLPVARLTPEQEQDKKRLAEAIQQRAQLETRVRDRLIAQRPKGQKAILPVNPIARFSFTEGSVDSVSQIKGELKNGAVVKNGRLVLSERGAMLITPPLNRELREKTLEAWTTLADLEQKGGGILTVESLNGSVFDSIVFAERTPRTWVAGSEFYRRTRDLKADPELAKPTEAVHIAITYSSDGKIQVFRNGKPYAEAYRPGPAPQTFATDQSRILMGLRHTGGGNAHFFGEIDEARVYDKALSAEEIAASYAAGPDGTGIRHEDLLAGMTAEEKKHHQQLLTDEKSLAARVPKPQPIGSDRKIYAVVPRQPDATHVLARGNVERKKEQVLPGGVAIIPGKADFGLKAASTDPERRKMLAEWITAPENPLFPRVIVNRLWQQHFGTGIVETPSDLGHNGGKPSHPELLDWLAGELIRNKFSLKAMHRIIVTSTAYRQGSARVPAGLKVDTDNRLLWRKSPMRLEAEMIRDAALEVAGVLNLKAGGPGFKDTREHGNAGTTFYEPVDTKGPEFDRRTIYRFSPRGERSTILETFDCPDPSAQTPRRQTTTTPLQALALWNNAQTFRLADTLADRVTAECRKLGESSTEAKVNQTYRIMLGRSPRDTEMTLCLPVVEKHGIAALARVLFNSNEFVVIE